jgi:hypothetical protein
VDSNQCSGIRSCPLVGTFRLSPQPSAKAQDQCSRLFPGVLKHSFPRMNFGGSHPFKEGPLSISAVRHGRASLFAFTSEERTALSQGDKHFQGRSVELQIPPLRYASVGMTKGGVALSVESG